MKRQKIVQPDLDTQIYDYDILKAELCLIDNGIEPDEAQTVLQALGYILLDVELYEED